MLGKWKRLVRRVGIGAGVAVLAVPFLAGTAMADTGTGTIAVCVTDSTGADVTPAAQTWWQKGSSHYLGAIGDSGCRQSEVPAGQVTVWAALNATSSSHKTVDVTAGETTKVDFYTTKVTIQYPGSVAYGGSNGDSRWFPGGATTRSAELLSNGTDATMFRMSTPAGQVRTPVKWAEATTTGKSANVTLVAMQVKNNDGTGQSGATARSFETYGYLVPGQTDANGLLGWAHPGVTTGDVRVEAKVNNTTQQQSLAADDAKLFTFQTTKVTLHYSEQVRYFYNATYANWFTKPSMELFEGTYPLQLRTAGGTGNPGAQFVQTDLVVPAPAQGPIEKSAVAFRLNDSTGAGLVGAPSYYLGGWHTAPATQMGASSTVPANTGTDAGVSVILLDGAPKNVTAAMTYAGTRQQLPAQNIQNNSVFYFHTTDVAVNLRNSKGNALDTGSASYYAGGWHTIGDTQNGVAHQEMLPGSYSFAMTYEGTRQQLNGQQVSGTTSNVDFKTTLVTVQIQKEHGVANIPANGSASYYAGGWHAIVATNPNNGAMVQTQMLPGTYSFAATLNGTRAQKNSVAIGGSAATVYFHAANVSTSLTVNGTAVDPADVASSYYAGGWHAMPEAGSLMLPGKYAFAVTYDGVRKQSSYTIVAPNANSNTNWSQTVAFAR